MDVSAVLAFWQPVSYTLPRQHFAATVKRLLDAGCPVAVAQVVGPGQRPIRVPPGVTHGVYRSDSCLFWKENLWNLAASLVASRKLIFVDTDVVFERPDWLAATCDALDNADIVQPFSIARWLGRDGRPLFERKSTALAVVRRTEPRPDVYHPGFAWAMTREAWSAAGGWYERHPAGGGDFAWAYALDGTWSNSMIKNHLTTDAAFWHTESYQRYQRHVSSMQFRIGVVDGVCAHLWHGEFQDRHYVNRCDWFPPPVDGEYQLTRRSDGLLEWSDPGDAIRARGYWLARKEDG